MLSFSERMAQGRDNAANRRYNGKSTGSVAAGHKFKRPDPVGLDRLESEYINWRKDWQWQCLAAVEWALFGDDWVDLCQF